MSSDIALENGSQLQDVNSINEVLTAQLNEMKVEDEDHVEDVTKLPLNMSEKFYLPYYISFENKSNNCWLNTALALLINNRTLYCNLKSKNATVLVKILRNYRNILMYYHNSGIKHTNRLDVASSKVKLVQELALTYLQPLLKCQAGMPDSTFNAVMNLIGSDTKAQSLFETSFSRHLECESCKTVRRRTYKKSVITLTRMESFDGSDPVSLCACPACKIPDQKMFLYYHSLPPCLLFHFENGAGEGVLEQMDFQVGARTYYLCGVITLNTNGSVPHFVTWIRNPDLNQWLECNDLNDTVSSFKNSNRKIDLKTIHMLCFETLDQMGVITNFSGPISTNNMLCNSDIPEITLSDDDDSTAKNRDEVFEGLDNHSETNPAQSTQAEKSSIYLTLLEKEKCVLQDSTSAETNAAQSTSTALGTQSPSVTEKCTNTVTGTESLVENEKCVLQGTSSVEHDAAASGDTASFASCPQVDSNENKMILERGCKPPKKKRSNPKPKVVMTEYEKRVMLEAIDNYMSDYVGPHFGFRKN